MGAIGQGQGGQQAISFIKVLRKCYEEGSISSNNFTAGLLLSHSSLKMHRIPGGKKRNRCHSQTKTGAKLLEMREGVKTVSSFNSKSNETIITNMEVKNCFLCRGDKGKAINNEIDKYWCYK